MKQFVDVVREIRGTLASIIIFFIILDSAIVFLITYLILAIIDLYPLSAIIPAVFYMGFSFYRETKLNKIRIVEKYYPELNEKLRTAADYANVDNEVVNELHKEVIMELHKVTASSFFNRKETITKIASIILICFVIIFITTMNLNLGAYKVKLLDRIKSGLAGLEGGSQDSNEAGDALGGLYSNNDIYGKRSVAMLGNEQIEVQIKPSSYEFIIRESDTESEEDEFTSQIPADLTAIESKNYRENIPAEKDKQQLIKNYFRKLAEG